MRVDSRFGLLQGLLSAGTLGMIVLALGCPGTSPPAGGGGGGGGGGEVIFPETYRGSFTLVRDCRNSIEHGSQIRVWVNDLGDADYLGDAAVLPAGTIVVKEEFAAATCDNDDDLIFWSVMRKETAGFDPAANDWRFQEVSSPNRAVTLNDKATCIGCHSAPECVARDLMCTLP